MGLSLIWGKCICCTKQVTSTFLLLKITVSVIVVTVMRVFQTQTSVLLYRALLRPWERELYSRCMWLSSGCNDECFLPHSILVLALCVVVQQLQKTLAFFIPFLCATFLSTIWKESILETTESDLWIWIFQQIHPPSAPTNQRKHCKCPGQDLPCSASAHDGLCCCIDMNFPNSITRVIT